MAVEEVGGAVDGVDDAVSRGKEERGERLASLVLSPERDLTVSSFLLVSSSPVSITLFI